MSIEHYSIYDIGTGEIVQWGTCGVGEGALNVGGDGQGTVYGSDGPWTSATHYVGLSLPIAYAAGPAAEKTVRPSVWHTWSNAFMTWIDTRTLAQAQENAQADITQRLNQAVAVSTFTHATKTFSADMASRMAISSITNVVALTAALPATFAGTWTAVDGTTIAIEDAADWTALCESLAAADIPTMATYDAMRAGVSAAATTDDVNDVLNGV